LKPLWVTGAFQLWVRGSQRAPGPPPREPAVYPPRVEPVIRRRHLPRQPRDQPPSQLYVRHGPADLRLASLVVALQVVYLKDKL
jgi:hypothetical protein